MLDTILQESSLNNKTTKESREKTKQSRSKLKDLQC
jgi:hypothetical protein